ncbi:MAG: TIM barrel protein [Phycisphaerales bacterium]|nr:TIM barrel protein [Phycisphaerales bacterium]
MNRREFINTTTAGTAAAAMAPLALGDTGRSSGAALSAPSQSKTFTLDYAPSFGHFVNHAGNDHVSQIDFMADAGFRSIEDNGMRERSPEDQKRIADALERHEMRMGVFVMNMDGAWYPSITTGKTDEIEKFVQNAKDSVEVAKRTNARWMTVVPGEVAEGVPMEQQTAHVIEALKQAAAVLEPHGIVMVCEPLNQRDHRGQFLQYTPQSIEIMKAVDSPSCMILQDLYHQQASEGNLIDHMNSAWQYIPYFQVGDNPGRREPGTGEINYANVFKHMHERGYTGIVGMEHGKSQGGKEGEVKLIEAYRKVDPT